MLCIDLWIVTLIIEHWQFVLLAWWLVLFRLCINGLVRHHVHIWFLAYESEVDAFIVFTNSHISQCFSVFTSLNDETQNWHSHRARLVLGIVLQLWCFIFSEIFYSRVSRLLYVLLSETCLFGVSHTRTIPEEPNSTVRHIDDLASVSNGNVFEFEHVA